jgi:hypothetical protein
MLTARIAPAAVGKPVPSIEVARATSSITAKGVIIYAAAPQSVFANICSTTRVPDSVRATSSGDFLSRIARFFAKPPVGFFRVAKDILRQGLDPRLPHDTIGFVNSQWLSFSLAMPLCAGRDDKSPNL